MFGYYIDLAVRSLRRNRGLTALMVLAIGVGIGASMTMLTVLHVMTSDPLPERSAYIYTPHLDPLPTTYSAPPTAPDPRMSMTWPDAMALLDAHRAVRQAAMASGQLLAWPAHSDLRPFYVNGRYTTPDIFAMFGIPFVSGSAWSKAEGKAHAHVVVLSAGLARKLFGTVDVVGKAVKFVDDDQKIEPFRVIGVTRDWAPVPLFYADTTTKLFSASDAFFLPLRTAVQKLGVSGNVMCFGKSNASSWRSSPKCSWLQYWVQLDTPAQVDAYRQYLVHYSAGQKALGNYQRPATNARLYSLMGWLRHEHLVPSDVQLQLWLALGFLGVCMLNVVALLLAKFLQRDGEISVRRALGARRGDIFAQPGVEAAAIGIAGGLLGLGLAQIGLWTIRQRPTGYAHMASMNVSMLLGTVVLAIVLSVFAGLLPAWRACRVPPALRLKTL